ncbi:hypothetical protein LINPERPRIM_LOCUS36617 [Linum perenne]
MSPEPPIIWVVPSIDVRIGEIGKLTAASSDGWIKCRRFRKRGTPRLCITNSLIWRILSTLQSIWRGRTMVELLPARRFW